jgi:hypothetical protein
MNWIKPCIFIVIALALFFSGFGVAKCKRAEVKQNIDNILSGEKPREVTYTVKQFQNYKKLADSLAKINGITTKYLNRYIHIIDTIKVRDTISNDLGLDFGYEIPEDCRVINVSEKCYALTVLSYPDTSIIDFAYPLDIHIFGFWKHTYTPFVKRVWKWNFSKINEMKAVNRCSGDSLNIEDNIIIEKR